MGENKNIFLALGLSLLVMIGYDQLYLQPQMEAAKRQYEAEQAALAEANGGETLAPVEAAATPDAEVAAPVQAEVLPDAGSVEVITPELTGSIALRGALIDDLSLVKHMTDQSNTAENVRLLTPAGETDAYFVRYGWAAQGAAAADVPTDKTVWTADKDTLTPDSPVTLAWDNGKGVKFLIKISVDDRFLFTIEQSVINTSTDALALAPYGIIKRNGLPETDGLYILHEGPIGVLNDTLEERSYADLEDDGDFETASTGGWLGLTDKFWMTVMIPNQNTQLSRARFVRQSTPGLMGGVSHRVDFVEGWSAIAAGGTLETTNRLYAGAKIVSAIDDYETRYQIALFDRTIDWGWFYWLTRPIFKGLSFFFEMTGNFGVAILLLTVVVKLILFPLANKSYVSMAKMKTVQPRMKSLQERYKDDRQKLQQEMMALYQKEGVNPMAGCLPMFLQIPVFFALYKVLYVTIEMRHQPFFGWITDLSAPDPLTPLNLFGLIPWDPPSLIAIGILPIMMGATMYLQQKMNPQTMEPTQQKIMNMLPLVFTFIMAGFSAGLVLYWTWNSLLSILQQWYIMRKEAAKES